VLLGPLALAFKKDAKTACFVVVEGTFGEFIFQVKKKSPHELRAAFAPWQSRLADKDDTAQPAVPAAPGGTPSLSPARDRIQLRPRSCSDMERLWNAAAAIDEQQRRARNRESRAQGD
jgi:hypothetical protein